MKLFQKVDLNFQLRLDRHFSIVLAPCHVVAVLSESEMRQEDAVRINNRRSHLITRIRFTGKGTVKCEETQTGRCVKCSVLFIYCIGLMSSRVCVCVCVCVCVLAHTFAIRLLVVRSTDRS